MYFTTIDLLTINTNPVILKYKEGIEMKIDFSMLGKRIAQRRHEMGLKQSVVAKKAGISNNYLSNIENGKSIPSLETFADICIALSTTPDYLLLGTLKSNSVPQTIIDGLNLCDNESLSIINDIISCFIKNNN